MGRPAGRGRGAKKEPLKTRVTREASPEEAYIVEKVMEKRYLYFVLVSLFWIQDFSVLRLNTVSEVKVFNSS